MSHCNDHCPWHLHGLNLNSNSFCYSSLDHFRIALDSGRNGCSNPLTVFAFAVAVAEQQPNSRASKYYLHRNEMWGNLNHSSGLCHVCCIHVSWPLFDHHFPMAHSLNQLHSIHLTCVSSSVAFAVDIVFLTMLHRCHHHCMTLIVNLNCHRSMCLGSFSIVHLPHTGERMASTMILAILIEMVMLAKWHC